MVHFSLEMMTRFYPDFHILNGIVSGLQIIDTNHLPVI